MKRLTMALTACMLFCSPNLLATESTTAADSPGEREVLKVGTKAPNFTRFTSTGKKISLKDFRGKKPVILYFYPKDESPGCIKEACGFRDFYKGLAGTGAEVIGVSGDNDKSHQAFAAHYSVPFDLIADEDNSLLRLYHIPFFKGSLHKRITYVIDKEGSITNVVQYTNDGDQHVREAVKAVQALNSRQ
jgi:thioredoxin-dependent peroxiredoxin